jgi:periplasmic binding family protein
MRRISKLGIIGSGVCALALIATSAPAFADYAPRPLDVVGVGSDTVQNINDFVADGDPFGDGAGYNGAGNKYKMISFDATPDANDRAGYLNGSTNSNLQVLNPTIVLRQGTTPVLRPNGSSAGIAALIADTAHKINYVRASRALKSTEETSYENANPGDKLDTVEISTDPLEIAYSIAATNPLGGTNPASNIPAAGLTVAQLTAIYSCSSTARTWAQVGGTGPNAGNDIVPLIPQTGSGTRSTFLGDIGVTTPGGCVQTVEENDPSAIATASQPTAAACSCTTTPANGTLDPADAIVPFSGGRLNLWNGVSGNPGYFHNPATAYPGSTTALSPGIALIAGTGTASTQIYDDVRGLFIILRNSDVNSTTAWQPGGTLNWAKTLFWGSTSYYGSGNGDPFITAAGGVPSYFQEPVGYAPN